ncbi:MAG: DMT family transporter [Lachnospiraceae bacterium]|nr:DMT family transporter [Lachnospiraceae bacterium]
MNNRKTIKSSLLLLLTATIWGVAFVAQSVGMDYVGPFTFNAVRFLMGGIVLFPLVWIRSRKQKNVQSSDKKKMWIGGLCCGLALCTASLFQQVGLIYTSVGNAGFITTLYIIIVPMMGLFFGKKVHPSLWFSAMIAIVGLYLLCVGENFSLNKGDGLVFICAVIFAIHILVIDYFTAYVDGVFLSCIQFFVSGMICTVGAIIMETPSIGGLMACWLPLVYAGVLSCGVAYTLQIIGQRDMDPTIASLILSLESVISVLAGWILLDEILTFKAIVGCLLVFAAVILVQLHNE